MILKDKRGATLIELLAVLTLISVILAVVTGSLSIWYKSTESIPKQTFNQERLRFAFEQLVKDIEEAEDVEINHSYPANQTLSLFITKVSGSTIYNYNPESGILSVNKQGNNYILAEDLISLIIYQENGIYYIKGKIKDIDLKTNQPYTLVTSAKPIVW